MKTVQKYYAVQIAYPLNPKDWHNFYRYNYKDITYKEVEAIFERLKKGINPNHNYKLRIITDKITTQTTRRVRKAFEL